MPTHSSIPNSELSGLKKSPTHTCYDSYVWDALPKEAKQAAMTMGYTKTSWETNKRELPSVDDAD
eukprot:scaffold45966_cov46-Attheya_sp.AAC.2